MTEETVGPGTEVRPPIPERPRILEAPEKKPEQVAEEVVEKEEVIVLEDEKITPPPAPPPPAPPKKDPTTIAVEKILEEDLGDLYVKLDPETRKKFRAKGDELTGNINTMVSTFKVKARKVLHLIRDWLKIIPGINKYFLEQEAKIKTDKIMELAEQEKQKGQGAV